MKLYVSDCGCVYAHRFFMYLQPWSAPWLRNVVTTPLLKEGTRYPWRNRLIRPLVPTGRPNRAWPVLSFMFFAHCRSWAYVRALTSAPFGRYLRACLLATM